MLLQAGLTMNYEPWSQTPQLNTSLNECGIFQVYETDLFRFRIGNSNYLFNDLVPRVYNPIHLLDLNNVVVKLMSMTKQVPAHWSYIEKY